MLALLLGGTGAARYFGGVTGDVRAWPATGLDATLQLAPPRGYERDTARGVMFVALRSVPPATYQRRCHDDPRAYATRHGATAGIADRIAAALTATGLSAEASPVEDVKTAARSAGWSSAALTPARRFGKDALITRATQIDAGFGTKVLADMIATLDRFTDSEIPVPSGLSAAELRASYAAWRSELIA